MTYIPTLEAFYGRRSSNSDRAMLTDLPNILTLSRILVVPVVVLFIILGDDTSRWIAFGFYTFACVTDYFDGYLARVMEIQSELGRLMDPIADKLLVGACLLALSASGQITGWTIGAALVILLREILVSGLREFLAEIQVGMPVSKLAKWKTTIQMLALGFVIVGSAGPIWLPTEMIGEVGLWMAAALTLITGYDYVRAGLVHVAPEEVARRRERKEARLARREAARKSQMSDSGT